VTACSVEPIDSTENLLTADAKNQVQEVGKSMDLLESEICAGEAPVFVFDFPQNQNGHHNADTKIKIQIETFPGSGEWNSFEDLTYTGAGPVEYTYNDEMLEVGTYNFRVKIGGGGFEYAATLNVVECPDCEESFSYKNINSTNVNNSYIIIYTFSYTPAVNMVGASLEFNFGNANVINGLDSSWEGNGVIKQKTMSLDACTTYEWTVEFFVDFQNPTGSNYYYLWKDFKVNGDSKKNSSTPNITQGGWYMD
jgi:hypothetical protein